MKELNWYDWLPVYITRPFGKEKMTGRISMRYYQIFLVRTLLVLNAIGWGVYGLVELADKVI
jgi:hypothetical protein